MEIKVIKKVEAERTYYQLKKKGYISRNIVVNKDYMKEFLVPTYKELRELAESNKIQSIRVDMDHDNHINSNYWFLREEIENIWINPEKNIDIIHDDIFIKESTLEEEKDVEILLATGNKVKILCPYTINAAQRIFKEGVLATLLAIKKTEYIIEDAERKEELDAMVLENGNWSTSAHNFDNYKIMR